MMRKIILILALSLIVIASLQAIELMYGVNLMKHSYEDDYFRHHIYRIDNLLAIKGNGVIRCYTGHLAGNRKTTDGQLVNSDVPPFRIEPAEIETPLCAELIVKNYKVVGFKPTGNCNPIITAGYMSVQLRLLAAQAVDNKPVLWSKHDMQLLL